MTKGHINLPRTIVNSPIWANPDLFRIFVWLVMRASHKDSWVSMKTGKGTTEVEVKRGQLVTGQVSASSALKINPSAFRRAISKLSKYNFIVSKNCKHYTLIEVVNYHDYQGVTNYSDNAKQTQRRPNDDATTTYNNVLKRFNNVEEGEREEKEATPTQKNAIIQPLEDKNELQENGGGEYQEEFDIAWKSLVTFNSQNLSLLSMRSNIPRDVIEAEATKFINHLIVKGASVRNRKKLVAGFQNWVMNGKQRGFVDMPKVEKANTYVPIKFLNA